MPPDPLTQAVSGVFGAMVKFGGIFAFTQIPLAIAEGLLTVVVIDAVRNKVTIERTDGIVKQIMAQHPDKVRLALRYAPFHHGSDQVVKLIEAARKQGLYTPVLEALLAAQPEWADHAAPNIGIAFEAAARARRPARSPGTSWPVSWANAACR